MTAPFATALFWVTAKHFILRSHSLTPEFIGSPIRLLRASYFT